jgi:hypothetical protein
LFSKFIHHVSRWLSPQGKAEPFTPLSASSLVNTESATIFKKATPHKKFSKGPGFGNKMQVAYCSSESPKTATAGQNLLCVIGGRCGISSGMDLPIPEEETIWNKQA